MTLRLIEKEIEQINPHTVSQWIDTIVDKGFSKPTEILPPPPPVPADCEMCDDTEYTPDGERCLCYYQKLNEDGYEF